MVALTRIWLLRHASTMSSEEGRFLGWADEGLSHAGRAEARGLRVHLSALEPEHVWSSDLRRAVDTARLAVGEPRIDARLRELDFGELEGKTWQECSPVMREALGRFEGFGAPGGESLDQLRRRVDSFLDELGAGRHLIVTHGGVIRALLGEIGVEGGVPPAGLVELGARTTRSRAKQAPVLHPPVFPAPRIRRSPRPSAGS